MVDIVDSSLGVDELDEILDDLDNVVVGQHPDLGICGEAEFLVQAEPSDNAQIIPLLGEEELVDDIPGSRLIRRFRVAELFVDIVDSLDLRVGRIFLEGVVDDGVLVGVGLVFLEEYGLDVCVTDFLDGVVVEDLASLNDSHSPLNGDDFSGVLVLKVFHPSLQNLGGELPALVLSENLRSGLDFVSESEDVYDVFVRIISDRPEKRGDRQLFLSVNVGVHDIVDVSRELDPGSFEGDDPG